MRITGLTLKQFRCFESHVVLFDKPFVIIGGPNGSGKTSILEALYYACYLRSFRTRTTRELIHFDQSAFSLKLHLKSMHDSNPAIRANVEEHEITVGYSSEKRIIKLNNISLTSYKELLSVYRIIALTGDDTSIIKGTPDCRRQFLDQAIMLEDTHYLVLLRKYAGIVAQRNALLNRYSLSEESYDLWTEQLLAASQAIRERRRETVAILEARVNGFLKDYFDAPFAIGLEYKPKDMPRSGNSLDEMMIRERAARYTLFGAHLDDCAIMLRGKTSRQYASKGQQKLIALLLKIAQPGALKPSVPASHASAPPACIFVVDDMVSDLDENKIERLCILLNSYQSQIIMTSPLDHPVSEKIRTTYDCQSIRL